MTLPTAGLCARAFTLVDHLIRPQHQRGRDGDIQGAHGPKVNDQLKLRRLLDGQVAGLRTLEDLAAGAVALLTVASFRRSPRHPGPGSGRIDGPLPFFLSMVSLRQNYAPLAAV